MSNCSDDTNLSSFLADLCDQRLIFSLGKKLPLSFNEDLDTAKKHIEAGKLLTSCGCKGDLKDKFSPSSNKEKMTVSSFQSHYPQKKPNQNSH